MKKIPCLLTVLTCLTISAPAADSNLNLLPGETLPDVPATNPVVTFAPVELKEVAPVFDNLPGAVQDEIPRNMEAYDQGYGCILYRRQIPAGPATTLEAAAIHDFGYVFLDGKRVGILDRRNASVKIVLPKRNAGAQLDILVEPMGRINFGPEMADRKGLIGPVKIGGKVFLGWEIFRLPLDAQMLAGLKFINAGSAAAPAAVRRALAPNTARDTDQKNSQVSRAPEPTTGAPLAAPEAGALPNSAPAFWRGTFNLEKAGDTFLDLRGWGKGDLWVNGHCLGRYWNIGPTQTAYAPGCWLHAGENEIVILDLLGPQQPEIAGLGQPILDELRPQLDFQATHRPVVKLNLDSAAPVHSGSFAPGADTQEIKFAAPATGRFFCLESLNAQDGKPFAAVAELDLLGADGKSISHDGWTIAYVDSEERASEDGSAENAIDGQTANHWHTQWSGASPDHPHQLILDLGRSQTISGFRYVPRQGEGGGRIKDYRVFVGDNLVQK